MQLDLAALTNELLAYMKTFDQVVAEETVAEKRRFIRAFVKHIDLGPSVAKRRILLVLPPSVSA